MEDGNDRPTADDGPEVGAYNYVHSIPTPEGVGKLVEVLRTQIEDTLIPRLTLVTEPGTGTQAFIIAGPNGLEALPAHLFDGYREAPLFRRGSAAMTSLDSFIAHISRFGDGDSAVFADDTRTAPKLTAVLDYNRRDSSAVLAGDPSGELFYEHGDYRHGRHRTTFAFPLSDEWKAWIGKNGVVMSMSDFARFLEDRIGDIAALGDDLPDDVERFVNVNGGVAAIADFASLVELSRGLKVFENAVVEEAQTLSSGEGHIRFSLDHTTKTAAGDHIKVPTMFFIAIPIFKKGAFYRIAARLRYRKTPEGVKFWFDLWREDKSFDHAFAEAVTKVDVETEAQVFFGAPEAT